MYFVDVTFQGMLLLVPTCTNGNNDYSDIINIKVCNISASNIINCFNWVKRFNGLLMYFNSFFKI